MQRYLVLKKQLDDLRVPSPRRPVHRARMLVAECIWPGVRKRGEPLLGWHVLENITNYAILNGICDMLKV